MLPAMTGRAVLWCACFAVGCASQDGEQRQGGAAARVHSSGAEAAVEGGGRAVLRGPPHALNGAQRCGEEGGTTCAPAFHRGACDDGTDGDCTPDPLRVTLAWRTGADLNLHLIDPSGEVVSWARVESVSGGHLDRSSRGDCDRKELLPPEDAPAGGGAMHDTHVERVRWSRNPPKGTYRVEVYYWGECHSRAGATVAQVSIAVEGEVHRFEHTMLPAERRVVARFHLD